uniref:Uncharacterized protein n=1 Tax=Rhizophora mucronata TaxID=61149 RepID=A0A2P2IJY4_RHIMU
MSICLIYTLPKLNSHIIVYKNSKNCGPMLAMNSSRSC